MVSVVAVIATYYAVPVEKEGGDLLTGVLFTLAGASVLGWAIAGQVRRHLVQGEDVGLPALVTLLSGVVAVFAMGYYSLALSRPGQMVGLETKTDSLYFTMQMLTTIGLGDVHAAGQVARVLALVQMVFDLVFVAAAGSLLAGSMRERMRKQGDAGAGPAAR